MMIFSDVIRKFNENHDRYGKFTYSDQGVPKKAGQAVDWDSEFSKVKTFSDAVKIVNAYMPNALDIAKARRQRKFELDEYLDSQGKWKDDYEIDQSRSKRGDITLADIYESRGYNGKPQMVSTEALDELISDGSTEFYRGFGAGTTKTSSEKVDEFLNGDTHYAGFGIFGSGTYAATDSANSKAYNAAHFYSDGAKDSIIRFTLSEDARVYQDLCFEKEHLWSAANKLVERFANDYDKASEEAAEKDPVKFINSGGEIDGEYAQFEDFSMLADDISGNAGYYAALRGYDAVDIGEETGYYLILNRSSMVIDEKKYT